MTTVKKHYANHLAPVYAWTVGGIESAVNSGALEIESLLDMPNKTKLVVDLGAGFGMHTIPLARKGYEVIAIDSSTELLSTLEQNCDQLPIKIINDDLLKFREYLSESPDALFCMGDTLTHLENTASVETLIHEASSALETGGMFVISFRNYSNALLDDKRFIPVRSDEERIFTCFLEYDEEYVTVYDLLHERTNHDGWNQRISRYRKLRLNPSWVCSLLKSYDFEVKQEEGIRGMVRLVARRA